MKFSKIVLCFLMLPFFSKGQDYFVQATFTLKEPRLLVFNEENKPLHDSLATVFKLSNIITQKDSIKIAGLVSYTEEGNVFYVLRLTNPSKMLSFKREPSSKNVEYFKFENDVTWSVETFKFDYLLSILNTNESGNSKLEKLIKSSQATYGGINITKLRSNIENNLIEYKEFLY